MIYVFYSLILIFVLTIGFIIGLCMGIKAAANTIDNDIEHFGSFRTGKAVYGAYKTKDIKSGT